MEHDFFQTVEKAHGRIETRSCWSVSDTDYIGALDAGGKWVGLSSEIEKVAGPPTLQAQKP